MPELPPSYCPYEDCGQPIKRVPAGISKKTGKHYGEFWSCSNYECDFIWRPPKPRPKIHSPKADASMGPSNAKLEEDLRLIFKEVKDIKEMVINIEAQIIARDIDPPTRQNSYDKETE